MIRNFLIILMLVCILGFAVTPHAANVIVTDNTLKNAQPYFVKTSVGQIEYYRFGQGTPIVLIAGYATNVSSWNRYFLQSLASQHEVIVFNNRNVDDSVSYSRHYLASDLANDTNDLIRALNLKKPTVVGISMGGMIAQELAVLHPENVGKLVLINTAIAGVHSVEPAASVKEVILNTPSGKIRRFMIAMKLLAPPSWRIKMAISLFKNRFQPANKQDLLGVTGPTLLKQQNLILAWSKDNKAAAAIAKIQIPTLILSGGADAVIPPQNSVILAQTIPHAKMYRWVDGGHAMIYQYPEDMANVINSF